jgi:hypothetical protein
MSVVLRIGDSDLHLADEFPEMRARAAVDRWDTVVLALMSPTLKSCSRGRCCGRAGRQPLATCSGATSMAGRGLFGHRWNITEHSRRRERRDRGRCGEAVRLRRS